jgi:hypothetical protein
LAAGHLGQAVGLVVEAFDGVDAVAAEIGRVDQAAVEAVAPIVIGADQASAPRAGSNHQLQAAVAADIVEGPQLTLLAAHQDDRAAGHRDRHDVARRRQLVGKARKRPAAGEDPVLLELQEPRAGIGFRRQAVFHRPGGLESRQGLRIDDIPQPIVHVMASFKPASCLRRGASKCPK